jgi:hypothetical protein
MREQALIALAIIVFVMFVLLQAIIGPVGRWRSAANDRAELAANNYRLVAQAAATAAPGGSGGARAATPPRNALIDTARALGVDLTFVNEHADGSIEFQAATAAPEKAFALFAALEQNFGVKIVAADMARSPEAPTTVRLQATVAR